MSTSDAPMKQCPECKGQGGWDYDCADSRGEHMTRGERCEGCEGTGEVEQRCECGGPAEHVDATSPAGWVCSPCKADIDADLVGQATRAEVRALVPEMFS